MKGSEESTCYFSSKLEICPVPEKGGVGMFAHEPIQKGELMLVMGGKILNLEGLANVEHTFSIQVEEDAYISPIQLENSYRINHSCNPNVGVVGQITFVALRDIAAGEEVTYDYAMTDGVSYDEFNCACGQANCRGKVTGNDWKLPELWDRYGDHFSPYLQRRIQRLKAELAAGQMEAHHV